MASADQAAGRHMPSSCSGPLEAGIFWGAVGAVRELLARQTFDRDEKPWIVWTGGDAERLARSVCGEQARIIPDLVLNGLVRAAF